MSNLRKINQSVDLDLTTAEDLQEKEEDLAAKKFKRVLKLHRINGKANNLHKINQVLESKILELQIEQEDLEDQKLTEQETKIDSQTVKAKKQISEIDQILNAGL